MWQPLPAAAPPPPTDAIAEASSSVKSSSSRFARVDLFVVAFIVVLLFA
jgi:hypothetical protein